MEIAAEVTVSPVIVPFNIGLQPIVNKMTNITNFDVNDIWKVKMALKNSYQRILSAGEELFLFGDIFIDKLAQSLNIYEIVLLLTFYVFILYINVRFTIYVIKRWYAKPTKSDRICQAVELTNIIQKNRIKWLKGLHSSVFNENDLLREEFRQHREQANTMKDITMDQVDRLESEISNYKAMVDRLNQENCILTKNSEKVLKEAENKNKKFNDLKENIKQVAAKNQEFTDLVSRMEQTETELYIQIENLKHEKSESQIEVEEMKEKLTKQTSLKEEIQQLYKNQLFANKLLAERIATLSLENSTKKNDDIDESLDDNNITSTDLPNLFDQETTEKSNKSKFFDKWLRTYNELEVQCGTLEKEGFSLKEQLTSLEEEKTKLFKQYKQFKDDSIELSAKNELLEVEIASIKKLHNQQADRYFKEVDEFKQKNRELTIQLNQHNSQPSEVIQRKFDDYILENNIQTTHMKKKIEDLEQEKQKFYIQCCASKREIDELLKEREFYREKLVVLANNGPEDDSENTGHNESTKIRAKNHKHLKNGQNFSFRTDSNDVIEIGLDSNSQQPYNYRGVTNLSANIQSEQSIDERYANYLNSSERNSEDGRSGSDYSSSSTDENAFTSRNSVASNGPPPMPPMPPIWMNKMSGIFDMIQPNSNNNNNSFGMPNMNFSPQFQQNSEIPSSPHYMYSTNSVSTQHPQPSNPNPIHIHNPTTYGMPQNPLGFVDQKPHFYSNTPSPVINNQYGSYSMNNENAPYESQTQQEHQNQPPYSDNYQ